MNFFLIDKPKNYTSFDVLKILKKKLGVSKIGHTGTLDPLATGALLVATGGYTKLIPYFEKDTKEYEFSVNFDGVTSSFDLETPVTYISEDKKLLASKRITKETLSEIIKNHFSGEIYQIPPKYSALKINGMKALDRVLNGDDFEMKKRKCTIYEMILLEYTYPIAKFKAKVSAGTYIRSIANDLGEILGTGGYISALRRTKIGEIDISNAYCIDDIGKEDYLSIKDLFKDKNFIKLNQEILEQINDGKKVKGKFDYEQNKPLFVMNENLITNIIEYNGNILIPKKKL